MPALISQRSINLEKLSHNPGKISRVACRLLNQFRVSSEKTDAILSRSKMKLLNVNRFGRVKAPAILVLIASLLLGVANQAGASLYLLTFNDGHGDAGSGQIDVQCANNMSTACSGYLQVTTGGATGLWTLYCAGGMCAYPGYIYSPSGAYIYNNAVYLGGSNPQYPTAHPLLDDYGLLFTQSNGNELNLWGNADGTYTLGGNVNGWQNFNVQISFEDTTIAPIPEASTWIACAFLLVPIGASAFRSWRRQDRSQADHQRENNQERRHIDAAASLP
jgi:hypothetical protein